MIHHTAVIDETVRVYGRRDLLWIGAGSRIDAFCVITVGDKGVRIGRRVHLGVGVCLFGSGGAIDIGDCCSLSPRATVFTSSDDMAMDRPVGPLMERANRALVEGNVTMMYGSAIGVGGVVFPGITIERDAIVGALSYAKEDVPRGWIVIGAGILYGRRRP